MTEELDKAKSRYINSLRGAPEFHADTLKYLQTVEAYISLLEMENLYLQHTVNSQAHKIEALQHQNKRQVEHTKQLLHKYAT